MTRGIRRDGGEMQQHTVEKQDKLVVNTEESG
jgi:hypothetical protein